MDSNVAIPRVMTIGTYHLLCIHDCATVAKVPITAFVTVHVVSKLVQRLIGLVIPRLPPLMMLSNGAKNEDELMATTVVQVNAEDTASLPLPSCNEVNDEDGWMDDRTVILPYPDPADTMDTHDTQPAPSAQQSTAITSNQESHPANHSSSNKRSEAS